MIEALIQSAESRGYRIRWHRGGPKAAWIPTKKAITLQHGLDDVHALCALAHELGVTNHLVAVWRNTHRPATPVN